MVLMKEPCRHVVGAKEICSFNEGTLSQVAGSKEIRGSNEGTLSQVAGSKEIHSSNDGTLSARGWVQRDPWFYGGKLARTWFGPKRSVILMKVPYRKWLGPRK